MPRQFNRLTALGALRAHKKGMMCDGGGLYLQVTTSTAKSWVFRFQLAGKERQMGLGPYPAVTLQMARERAADCRRLLLSGIDPIRQRDAKRTTDSGPTFKTIAERLILTKSPEWKNAKHRQQWRNTLTGGTKETVRCVLSG